MELKEVEGGGQVRGKITLGQFEGCILGTLVGDCLGLPYENESDHHVDSGEIQHFFERLSHNEESLKYSDDSSMTKTFAEYLTEIRSDAFDPRQLAKKFTEAYFAEKKGRGYGSDVPIIFKSLQDTKYAHPFKPSHKQFRGQGSPTNGAAMRISPLSLMTINDLEIDNLIHLSIATCRITHGNPLAIVGGIFQAMAVRQALLFGMSRQRSEVKLSEIPSQILQAFRQEFKLISTKQFPFAYDRAVNYALKVYAHKFRTIRKLLGEGNSNLSVDTIKSSLGVKVAAIDSVPTAFFCFLAAFQEIPFIKTDNQYRRTIQLAITCGGDSDTIASMAGGMAGGYLGLDEIPGDLLRHCEDHPNFRHTAQKLFEKHQKLEKESSSYNFTREFRVSSHKCQIS